MYENGRAPFALVKARVRRQQLNSRRRYLLARAMVLIAAKEAVVIG